MSESIRSITFALTIDTNKRTFAIDESADSLDDALDKFREAISDVRWSL